MAVFLGQRNDAIETLFETNEVIHHKCEKAVADFKCNQLARHPTRGSINLFSEKGRSQLNNSERALDEGVCD